MYVETPGEAHTVLDEVLSRIDLSRFPVPIKLSQLGNRPSPEEWMCWSPRVRMTLSIRDRVTREPQDISIFVPLTVEWKCCQRGDLLRDFVRAVYQSVRQAVLHEIAECFEYEGRLYDDPHAEAPYSLRPEHDVRFPDFRNVYKEP